MAGQFLSDASGYEATEFDTKIPSLTDQANIVEAFKLYHYGIDNYSGTGAPSSDSVHAHLKDINDRLTEVEESSVNSLTGTVNEISVSASVGNVVIGLPDDVTITDDLTVGGDLSVTGDLQVSGSTTFINTTNLSVKDPLILLASDNAANSVDLGTVAKYNSSGTKYSGLVKDVSDSGKWKLFSDITSDPSTTVDFTSATYDTLKIGSLESTSVIATSATLDTITSIGPSDIRIPQNAQTGSATYTLVLSDVGKMVERDNSSANSVTVPPNSEAAFPIGSQVIILQTGSGQTTIAAGIGVTVNGSPGLKLRAQWTSATLIKRATNTWVAIGDLAS
jgi:hypothetical protein